MQSNFYLGRHRKKRGACYRILRPFLILLCILLMLTLFFNFALLPQIKSLCERVIENRLEGLAAEEAYRLLCEEGYTYDSFIRLSYNGDGEVKSASVDTVKLNLLKNKLSLAILAHLYAQNIRVSVPVSNLFGLLLFSGMGEDLTVSVRVSPSASASFSSVFEEAGINQTRHALSLSFCFSVTYLLPTGKEEADFLFLLPIAETIIVGSIPDSFTDISRLTDDISEIEIDDAVDFGSFIG